MARVIIFGQIKLLKRNPWLSGRLAEAVAAGLAKPRKDLVIASPPPWLGDPGKLSDAQLYQVLRFTVAATAIKGKGTLKQRLAHIKAVTSGATGRAKPRVRVLNIGRVITVAQARGIPVPPEVQALAAQAPTPTPTPAPTPGIRP